MQICTDGGANENQLLKISNKFLFTILCDIQYNKEEEVMVWRIMNFRAFLRSCAGVV